MSKRREIWVADSETDPFKKGRIPKPFIWGLYNGEKYYEFDCIDKLIDFVRNKRIIVYAHNGGKFDWHFALHHLSAFTPLMIISGRIAKFKIGLCEFRDSYNILPVPLAAYQKQKFDYNKLEKSVRHKHMTEIKDYLKSDCIYQYEMVSQFIDNYGLNLTLASSALKFWQKIEKRKAPKTNKMFYDEFFPYYYGGRVQCFKTGEIFKDFKVIDINSAYPFAMKHFHPYGNGYHTSSELPQDNEKLKQSFIKLECKSTGIFPFRTKKGLEFPNDGEYRTFTITGWEYYTARKIGKLVNPKIIEVRSFYESINFTTYIDHFYKMKNEKKKEGDKAGYLFAKLFLNSLYGKFAANPEKYHEFHIIPPNFIESAIEDGYDFTSELGQWAVVQKPLEDTKQRYYHVALAASITGFVRAYLANAMHKCKNVYYCDTDSIACEDTGALNLSDSKLGDWDIEANCDYGAIAGKKLYAFRVKNENNWKIASKGVKLTSDEIIKVAKGETITYENIAPTFSIKKEPHFIDRKITMNIV